MSNYPDRLETTEIKYLALEGGGGKGNAFVGALESLAHPSLAVIQNSGYRLTNILGVSGASAGAITSLFLAAGFTPFELKTITELEDFNNFFDGPHPGRVFRIGGFQDLRNTDPETAALIAFTKEAMELCRDMDVRRMAAYVASHVHVGDIVRMLELIRDRIASLADIDSPGDALEAITTAIREMEALGGLVLADVPAALAAVQSLLEAIPGAVWNHLVVMSQQFVALVRLRVERQAILQLTTNINFAVQFLRAHLDDATYQQLLNREIQATAEAFVSDFGVLTGEEIYKFFRRWLAVARMRVNSPAEYEHYLTGCGGDIATCFAMLRDQAIGRFDGTLNNYMDENMTFEAFESEFQVKFAVTGTNLETLTSHVFSGRTTPNFYVVDAVRLSMSLPYCIFKPLIIRSSDPLLPQVLGPREHVREVDPVSNTRERHPLIGVWVDGGLLNNIPSHVFDRERGGGETLALRLGSVSQSAPVPVNNIVDYYQQFPGGMLFGTGEALATRSYDNKYRSIALDTGDLGLLSFQPTAAQAAAVRTSAIEYVFRYFDQTPPDDL